MYTCQNKDFLPSFPQRFATGIDADKYIKDKANCIVHAYSTYQKKVQGGSLNRAFFSGQNDVSEQSANLVEYGSCACIAWL